MALVYIVLPRYTTPDTSSFLISRTIFPLTAPQKTVGELCLKETRLVRVLIIMASVSSVLPGHLFIARTIRYGHQK